MDFDDLDEVAPVAENKQPPTGTVLDWVVRNEKIPGLTNSTHRFSEKVLRELDPATRTAVVDRSDRKRAPTAKLRLLCIHGVADSYEQSWFQLEAESPSEIEVVIHEFPGHGRRDGEPVMSSIQELTEDAFDAFRDAMETGSFAFLGHSIGCLVALELAKRAQEELNVKPVAVIMVERGAPQFPLWTEKGLKALSNEEFSLEVDAKSTSDSGLELKSVDLDGAGGKEVILMINTVSDEISKKWAAGGSSNEVRHKDEIMRVNGESGNADLLRAELCKAADAGGKVKLDVLRRPHDFLNLHQPVVLLMCKAGPNRTFLRWQRSWVCENDTREVGYFSFGCPLVAMGADSMVEAFCDRKSLDPYNKAVFEYGGAYFKTEGKDGRVFIGHFPRETFPPWKDWTEIPEGFKYVECPACDHMTIKDNRMFKRTIWDTLMEQVKLW